MMFLIISYVKGVAHFWPILRILKTFLRPNTDENCMNQKSLRLIFKSVISKLWFPIAFYPFPLFPTNFGLYLLSVNFLSLSFEFLLLVSLLQWLVAWREYTILIATEHLFLLEIFCAAWMRDDVAQVHFWNCWCLFNPDALAIVF